MTRPQALLVCVAAQQAVHFVGLPEANLALAQAVVHLATAPKSNASTRRKAACRQMCSKPAMTPFPCRFATPPRN